MLGAQARDGLAVRELPRGDAPGTQRRPGDTSSSHMRQTVPLRRYGAPNQVVRA